MRDPVLGPRVLGMAPALEGTQVSKKAPRAAAPQGTLPSTNLEPGGLQGAGPTVEMRLREGRDRPHVRTQSGESRSPVLPLARPSSPLSQTTLGEA